jgi:hypothetical protein
MEWIKRLFKKKEVFILPKPGDKVGFSAEMIKRYPDFSRNCYEVKSAIGHEKSNIIYLTCSTVFYTGEWKILPKDTPLRH